MSDTEKFIPGLYFNLPREGAPDFVLGGIKIDLPRFVDWAKAEIAKGETEARADLKRSKDGKGYAERNTWKPSGGTGPTKRAPDPRKAEAEDDIPFIRCDSVF
jgi:hypothetical protein